MRRYDPQAGGVSESEPPWMLQQAIGHNHNLKDLALFQQPQGFG